MQSNPAKFSVLALIALAMTIANGETSKAPRGSGCVNNDAVYWFRGGTDINGNGTMDGGEAFERVRLGTVEGLEETLVHRATPLFVPALADAGGHG